MIHRFRPSLYRICLLILVTLGAGCAHAPQKPGKAKALDIPKERAEKVEKAATATLGHDKFSVCYVEGGIGIGPETSLQSMVGLGHLGRNKDSLTTGISAGFADNQKAGLDVVMDGPDPGKSDRLAREALELLDTPLPGLDLVLFRPPSAELRSAAMKYGVTLHAIAIE